MARKKGTTFTFPTTFVGTFYDKNAGVYIATRKDGSLTVGQMNRRGVNVRSGFIFPDALLDAEVEH
jgi:hypothetical protein